MCPLIRGLMLGWMLINYESLCFHLHRHITGFLWGHRQTQLLPVCKPQWSGQAGQVGGEWGILGRGHLRAPQGHLDPRLRLIGVLRQARLLHARHPAPPPPAQIQTQRRLPQSHSVQTDRSATLIWPMCSKHITHWCYCPHTERCTVSPAVKATERLYCHDGGTARD